eukprot:g1226.t1
MTCLMWTCQWDNVKIARRLLDAKALVNAASKHGVTPLMFAADGNAQEIVKLLLENQASAEAFSKTLGDISFMRRRACNGAPKQAGQANNTLCLF